MWNLKQFGEVSIFDRKMPTAPDLRKRMKFWNFLKVLRNSWNLQNLLESPPGTCMWNLEQFGEVSIFDRKMPTVPDLRKRMKFWHFLKVLRNSWNLQNLMESHPGTCMCNLKQFGKVSIFDRKMTTAPDLRKMKKFWHFLKVLRNSWNLQNLLESPPETSMWNLEQFGEVSIYDRKMPTAPDLRERMNFWHFLKGLQNSWNLQNLLESLPETCIWNLKQLGEVSIFDIKMLKHAEFEAVWRLQFDRKMPTEKGWNFDILSKFSKIHETYRIYWNHYQKHACEIWSSLEKFQFLTEKCRQRRTLEKGWYFDISQMSPKFRKLTEFIFDIFSKNHLQPGTCIWNLKQFGEVSIFDRKMPTAPDLRKRMKFWHFLKVLRNSWNLQNLLESPPGTCMWNLEQFGEVSIFDRKMPTVPDLRKRMKFWHFLKVLQNSWNLQNLLESPPGTCMCNLKQFGKVSIFDRKMPTAPDLRKRMKFWHFLKVLRNSWHLQNLLESLPGTCMWNLEQFGEVSIFDRKMPTA